MAEKRRSAPGPNLFLILVMVAIFAVAIYFVYIERDAASKPVVIFGKDPKVQKQELQSALNQKYESKTLQYIDQAYGYKIRFPIGYDAILNPFPEIHQRFAAFYPPFSMELIDIRILQGGELSEQDILDAARDAKITASKETINGKTAYLLNTREQSLVDENETIFIKQAFFDCRDPEDKRYWLSLTAGISEALAPDLELVEYMISSIEC